MLKKFWAKLMGSPETGAGRFYRENQTERELALERQRLARERMQAQGILPRKEEATTESQPAPHPMPSEERHEEAA
ncbi:MAG: hypothetical protein AAB638_01325 [Patescibacteria group bacterium]